MVTYAIVQHSTPYGIVLLILYVDDMVITESNHVAIASLKRHLQSKFEMKDSGFLCYFLGIEVDYLSCGISYLNSSKSLIFLSARATLSEPIVGPKALHISFNDD